MKNSDVFLIFAQNIDCGYMVLTSTHNLCFRAKIRNNVYTCNPQFYYIKVGCKGVYITRICFHDEKNNTKTTYGYPNEQLFLKR